MSSIIHFSVESEELRVKNYNNSQFSTDIILEVN